MCHGLNLTFSCLANIFLQEFFPLPDKLKVPGFFEAITNSDTNFFYFFPLLNKRST